MPDKNLHKNAHLIAGVFTLGGCLFGIGILLTKTNPDLIGPIGIVGMFVLLYAALCAALFTILQSGALFGRWHTGRNLFYSLLTSAFPIILLALSTFRQLNPLDVLLVLTLLLFLLFYLQRYIK